MRTNSHHRWFRRLNELVVAGGLLVFLMSPLGPATATATTHSRVMGSTLRDGQSLSEGQFLRSVNDQYTLTLATNGDLLLRDANLTTLWSDRQSNSLGTNQIVLRANGDLVAVLKTGRVEWSTRTKSHGSTSLTLQGDGNLVLRNGGGPLWSTNTGRGTALPEGLRTADHARQLIIVTAANTSSSRSQLTTWQLTRTGWEPEFGTMTSLDGENGWLPAGRRREGDGTTPEGIYSLGTTIYGNDANPGVAYRYHRLIPGDYWDENPLTGKIYNTFQHSSNHDCAHNPFGGDTECLWLETADYPYFVVIQFNTPARGAYGSGIFLHATYGSSEGCVSVSRANLEEIIRWLKPTADPLIVLAGPTSLARY